MRTLIKFQFVSLCLLLLTACGGNEGEAYISINWETDPLTYNDNNPAVPTNVENGRYYNTEPGTYAFTYTASDSSVWRGNYTITVNKVDGFDFLAGTEERIDDKRFRLQCNASGPRFTETAFLAGKTDSINGSQSIAESDTSFSMTPDTVYEDIRDGGELTVIEKTQGNYHMRIEFIKAMSGLYGN